MCGRVRLKWEVEISYDCGVSAFLVVLIDTLILHMFCLELTCTVVLSILSVLRKKMLILCYALSCSCIPPLATNIMLFLVIP